MCLRVPNDCFRVDPEDHPGPWVRSNLILQDPLHILNESQGAEWLFQSWPWIPFQYRAFTYTQTHQNGEKWAKFIKNGKKSEFIEAWAQVKAEHDFIFIYQLRFKGSVPLLVVGGPFQPCNYSIVTLGIFFIWIVLKSCKGEAKYYSWN